MSWRRNVLTVSLLLACLLPVQGWAATFTQTATTTFDSFTEDPISESGVWTNGTGWADFHEAAGVANVGGVGSDSVAQYTGIAFNNNQYSRAQLTMSGTTGGGSGLGLCVRQQVGAKTNYEFVIDHAGSTNAFVTRRVAGSAAVDLDSWTQAFADGDEFTLAVEGAGTSTVLYVYDKTLTLVRTIADSAAHTAIDSGSPGLFYSSSETSASVDNWKAGTFSSGGGGGPTCRGGLLLMGVGGC